MAATDVGFGISITFSSGFFAEIIDVSWSGMTREPVETTHSGTTGGFATFIPSDIIDHGEITVTINFDPDTDPPIDSAAETCTITFPTPAGGSTGATWAASAFMTGASQAFPIGDRMTQDLTLKVSGDVTYVDAT